MGPSMTCPDEKTFLDTLQKGVAKASNFIALATEFHGGPITTEYFLTTAIACEFIKQRRETKIECLNRTLINNLTAKKGVKPKKTLGSKRTDIVVWCNSLIPQALIEVKIGVKTLRKVQGDIDKIISTISLMKPQYVTRVIGAVVFQVHILGNRRNNLISKADFKSAIECVEQKLRTELASYEQGQPNFIFEMNSLQNPDQGITPRAREENEYEVCWGEEGHATRYYAITIRSSTSPPASPRTFQELKAQSLG